MAANAGYQPAPQRDSLEEPASFSHAPPTYEATAESPREEDDNVPDDFKVGLLPCLPWLAI
jgi:protein lifeguard